MFQEMILIFVLKELTLIFIYINKGKLHQNVISNENETVFLKCVIISVSHNMQYYVYNSKIPKLFQHNIFVFDNFFSHVLVDISRKHVSHSCAALFN